MLDRATSGRAFGHRPLVSSEQERGRRRRDRQALSVPDRRQIVVVLACPVDVETAGTAVPLAVRRLSAALWTPQFSEPKSIALQSPSPWPRLTTTSAAMACTITRQYSLRQFQRYSSFCRRRRPRARASEICGQPADRCTPIGGALSACGGARCRARLVPHTQAPVGNG